MSKPKKLGEERIVRFDLLTWPNSKYEEKDFSLRVHGGEQLTSTAEVVRKMRSMVDLAQPKGANDVCRTCAQHWLAE